MFSYQRRSFWTNTVTICTCIQLARLELDVAFQKQLLQQRREVPRGAFAATTAVNPTVSHPQIPPPPPQGVPLHHESSASAAPQLTKMQQGGFSNGTTTNGGSMPLRQPGASLVTAAAASGSFSSGSSVSHTKEPQFAWRPAVWIYDALYNGSHQEVCSISSSWMAHL